MALSKSTFHIFIGTWFVDITFPSIFPLLTPTMIIVATFKKKLGQ
jgi:hypothetical protein